MITPIIIITSALLIWNPIIREDKKDSQPASSSIGAEQIGILGNADIKSGGGSVGWGSGKWVNKDNKSPLHEFDFYPVITTDLNLENVSPIDQLIKY